MRLYFLLTLTVILAVATARPGIKDKRGKLDKHTLVKKLLSLLKDIEKKEETEEQGETTYYPEETTSSPDENIDYGCNDNEFECDAKCMPLTWLCDGQDDCYGGVDEEDCPLECSSYEWMCADETKCVPEWHKCDGKDDCSDDSDEKDCECEGFECGDGRCIKAAWRCDGGRSDCRDGSDEEGCATTPPPTTQPQITGSPETNAGACGTLPEFKGFPSGKRIVGGKATEAHKWPSICSLQITHNDKEHHVCGATLVKNSKNVYYVISAAHCFFDCVNATDDGRCLQYEPDDKERYSVLCGIHNLKGDTPSHAQRFKIKAIRNHEDFEMKKIYPDISVVELHHQPVENDFVQAACLAKEDHVPKEKAYIAGWGALSEDGEEYPDELQEIYKPIDSDEYCDETFESSDMNTTEHRAFCAGHRGGGRDSCQGDSGGPLWTHRHDRWTLTGVVSWGRGCGRMVGVYADVYSLRKWINSKIEN